MSELDTRHDRTVVISGAGTGIGRAIAVKCGELAWRVGIGGRRSQPLDETKSLVEAAGGTCFTHTLDVSDATSVEEFFAATESALGPVSAVVNNAASAQYHRIADAPPSRSSARSRRSSWGRSTWLGAASDRRPRCSRQ